MSLLGISKKGKWIVGGICAFAIVATASTGLASWVIGQNKKVETNGQLTAASVNDVNIVISDLDFGSTKIVFGPKSDDLSGMVRYDGTSGVTESLTATLTGKITYGSNADFDTLKFTFALDTSEGKTSTEVASAYTTAISSNYIVAPGTDGDGVITASFDRNSKPSGSTFTQDITFAWGAAFNNKNPGIYFDETSEISGDNLARTYENASTALNALYKINDAYFKVTVEAVKTA